MSHLHELIDRAIRASVDTDALFGVGCIPWLVATYPDGRQLVLGIRSWGEPEDGKLIPDEMVAFAEAAWIVGATHPEAVAIGRDSYMSTYANVSDRSELPDDLPTPSEDPEATEAYIVIYRDQGETRIRTIGYHRGDHGEITYDEPQDVPFPEGDFSVRMRWVKRLVETAQAGQGATWSDDREELLAWLQERGHLVLPL